MAGSNNFLQWNPGQANQESDAAYLADSQRTGGAPTGNIFPSQTGNKLYYQLSTFVAAFAQMMATKGFNMLDTNLATLASVLSAVLTTADLAGNIQSVPFSSTVNLDCSKFNGFQISLNGNVSLNLFGMVPGQKLVFIFIQDATGGRTVTFPGTWFGQWQPDPTSNVVSAIAVEVDASGTGFRPVGPMLTDVGLVNTPINQRGTPAAAKFPTQSAGDNTTNAATTAFVTAAIAAAISALGITITGNSVRVFGLIFKWGETSVGLGDIPVTFPVSFPTTCWQVMMTDSGDDGDFNSRIWLVHGISASGFIAHTNGTGSGKWLAIGH